MGGQPSEITLVGEKESFFVSNAVKQVGFKARRLPCVCSFVRLESVVVILGEGRIRCPGVRQFFW
jgi:hypothetical protein